MNVDSDHGRSQSRDHVPIQTGTPTGSQIRSMSLKDGTRCQIRPIGRDDPDVVNACFAGLSPASRRLRFFSAKQALTAADLAYLTNADGRDHLAFAAIGLDQDGRDGEVLGALYPFGAGLRDGRAGDRGG